MRALVVGGTSNIGQAVVKDLLNNGYSVDFTYTNNDEKANLLSKETNCSCYKVDIRKQDQVESLFKKVQNLDLLVLVSGIFSLSYQQDLELSEFTNLIDINIKGTFLCAKHCVNSMKENSSIVTIASMNAFHPGFGQTAHYDASKGFVVSYTKSLAAELAPKKIRVNSIAPGLIEAEYLHDKNNPVLDMFINRAVLKKTVKVEDVSNTVLFLASNQAIDGVCIVVDCGYLIG